MPRAALYARVSYFDRQGENLDDQLRICREYAAERQYSIVAELKEDDKGASGAEINLPALNRALDLAERGLIDVLVVRELDRFARSLAKQIIVENRFTAHGCVIEFALYDFPDTPEGRLNKQLRAVIAEYEREQITERMARGRYRAARRGQVMVAGKPPYGYRIAQNDGKEALEINESEADVVRKIFHWYVYELMSFRAITKRLTELRIPTAADLNPAPYQKQMAFGHWNSSVVRKIVMRRTYTGEWIYHSAAGNIVVDVPSIIDRELYAKAQRRRKAGRATSKRNVKYDYLIRGRVFCAKCGYRIQGRTRVIRGATYHYYVCPGSSRHGERLTHYCGSRLFRADKADAAVWAAVRNALDDPAAFAAALVDDEHESDRLRAQITSIENRIVRSRDTIGRLVDLYAAGRHTQAIVIERQRRLELDIERLTAERADLLATLDDATLREAQARDAEQMAAELSAGLAEADDDFAFRRWILEMLNINVKLEQIDKANQAAHLYAGDQHFTTCQL